MDGCGIRYTEFLAATIESFGGLSEERLAEAFDRLDNDDTGYISASDLREILGADFPKVEINRIMKEASWRNPNRITYPEFLALWDCKEKQNRSVGSDRSYVSKESDTTSNAGSGSVGNFLSRNRLFTGSSSTNTSDEERADLLRESDEDSTDLARENFLQGKQLSERKFSLAAKSNIPDEIAARKVLFDSIPESC